ncbi:general transcription factor IIE subunit 2 [Aplysia californica]|uniref:Transcription initiation factor IIE subunit beta n=1 Tax=Aplysia californica TaxID=6500 RepID=A0ABM1W3I4_APLCA|nr:general transcription factor IIE subunit 2 [Aplysia californica]XP_035829227.1 general transcription factor IIE subunit 2 [Aplysia californica]
MDPALLKEREAFLKRAKATPAVEKRKIKSDDGNDKKAKKPKMKAPPPPKPQNSMDYKISAGSSQYKFGILTKIVKHMKTKHQSGLNDPLELEEILDETSQLDITTKMRRWLSTESLVNNPKITVVKEDGVNKFCFKPKFDIHDRRSLMKLLKSYDIHGRGGILMDDIEESLPNMDKVLKSLQEHIIFVTRPTDKKQILFYNDRYCRFSIDEDFQKLWRSVGVEGLDEQKIEEYLNKQGISSMDASGFRKVSTLPKRKKGKQQKRTFKKHNDHLEGVLQDYTENPPAKK